MDSAPRCHIAWRSVKAGTAAALMTDRERKAVAARGPYFHVLKGINDAGELHGPFPSPIYGIGRIFRGIKRPPKDAFQHYCVVPPTPVILRRVGVNPFCNVLLPLQVFEPGTGVASPRFDLRLHIAGNL